MLDLIKPITIFKGDDSDAFNIRTITINLKNVGEALAGATASFKLLSFKQDFTKEQVATGHLTLTFSSALTKSLPLGEIFGSLTFFDSNNKVLVGANHIPFKVKLPGGSYDNGYCRLLCRDYEIEINVGVDYNAVFNKPTINGVALSGDLTSKDLGLASSADLEELKHEISLKITKINELIEVDKENIENLQQAWKEMSESLVSIKAELAKKVDKVEGKGLSTNDFTNALWNKLSNIQAGAQVNKIEVIKVNGVVQPIQSGKTVEIEIPREVDTMSPGDATEEDIGKAADAYYTRVFVNSSISTNTANYISKDGQPFDSLEELEAVPESELTNNDYAIVVSNDGTNNTYTRYKYNANTKEWAKEWTINNSSFTAEQWAAINSGINADDWQTVYNALTQLGETVTAKIHELFDNAEEMRYPCYENANIGSY